MVVCLSSLFSALSIKRETQATHAAKIMNDHFQNYRPPIASTQIYLIGIVWLSALCVLFGCISNPGEMEPPDGTNSHPENDVEGPGDADHNTTNQVTSDADNQTSDDVEDQEPDTSPVDEPDVGPDAEQTVDVGPQIGCADHYSSLHQDSDGLSFALEHSTIAKDSFNVATASVTTAGLFGPRIEIQKRDNPNGCDVEIAETCTEGDDVHFHICDRSFDEADYCVFLFGSTNQFPHAYAEFSVDYDLEDIVSCQELPCFEPDGDIENCDTCSTC